MIKKGEHLGIHIPEILLPLEGTDLTRWSVVACDQYTSQPEYWKKVETYIEGNHSTLDLIFPEIYLEDHDKANRIAAIHSTMQHYITKGILRPLNPGLVLIDRQTSHAPSRKGILIAIDLEQYDYRPGSSSLIRATEGTVLDRLPPRIQIREHALLELPHIMVLIDDPEQTVIEPLFEQNEYHTKLYDHDLMMGGGHLKGYHITDDQPIAAFFSALEGLARPETFQEKYGVSEEHSVLLFAVGDGNHSLATAKACWERLKINLADDQLCNHPARYALVELVNVHDEGLVFEPIHRVVFNVDPRDLLDAMADYSSGTYRLYSTYEEYEQELNKLRKASSSHLIPFITHERKGVIVVDHPSFNLEVGTLQAFLDQYLSNRPESKIDYIHGEDVVRDLGARQGNIGFFLPPMDKKDLFKTVVLDGVLPRKTFSMGEAEEKRFYLECRKIQR